MCRPCTQRPRCCFLFLFASGTLLLMLGIWATHLYSRFTPVYSDITCHFASATLDDLSVGVPGISPTTFQLTMGTNCSNPNPYTIGFGYAKKGGVFLGSERMRVGDAMATPFSKSGFPAQGDGAVYTTATVQITGELLAHMLTDLMTERGIPLYVEVDQKVAVDIKFFFGSWSVKQSMKKVCGMMLAGLISILSSSDTTLGPMACADSFDDLKVPPLSSAPSAGRASLKFDALKMAPDEIQKGEAAKNIGLGGMMGLGYGLGAVLLLGSLCLLRPALRAWRGKGYAESVYSDSDGSTYSE